MYYEDNLGMSNLIWLPRGALDWKKEMSHGCEFLSNFFVGLYCSHKYFFFSVIFVVDCNEGGKKPPWYLVEGAKALSAALKTWTHKREVG